MQPLRTEREVADLVTGSQRWIAHRARQFEFWYNLEFDDLMQVGLLECVKAARVWKQIDGCQFMSFAWRSVNRGMYRHVKNTANTIRIPEHLWGKAHVPCISMELPITGDGYTVADTIADESCTTNGDALALSEAMDTLTAEERTAISWLYISGLSAAETAKKMGSYRQMVRNIEAAALAKLRARLNRSDEFLRQIGRAPITRRLLAA